MKQMLNRAVVLLWRYRAALCAGILVSVLGFTAYRVHDALVSRTSVRTYSLQPTKAQAPEAAEKSTLLTFPAAGETMREWTDAAPVWSAGLGMYETHTGVDFSGEEVYCVRDGIVESVKSDWLYGLVVTVRHDDDCESVYASLGESFVREGLHVSCGTRLGRTGVCLREADMDAHVHFEYHINGESVSPPFAFPVDP